MHDLSVADDHSFTVGGVVVHNCHACAAVDGREYPDLQAAREDYPLGGYRDCDGQARCRGTLVFEYGPGGGDPPPPPPSILDDYPDPDPTPAPAPPPATPRDDEPDPSSPLGLTRAQQAARDAAAPMFQSAYPVGPLPERARGEGQRFTDWGQVRLREDLKRMDPESLALTTNPWQSVGKDYQVNCTSCVTAYEARRRGLDVVAAPVEGGRGRVDSDWLEF